MHLSSQLHIKMYIGLFNAKGDVNNLSRKKKTKKSESHIHIRGPHPLDEGLHFPRAFAQNQRGTLMALSAMTFILL